MAQWYNPSFNPDSTIVQGASVSPFGTFLKDISKVISDKNAAELAKQQWDDEYKLKKINADAYQSMAQSQINANSLNQEKYDDTVAETNRLNAIQYDTDRATIQGNTVKDFAGIKGFDGSMIGLPSYAEMQQLPEQDRALVQSEVSNLLNRYKQIQEAKAIEAENNAKIDLEKLKQKHAIELEGVKNSGQGSMSAPKAYYDKDGNAHWVVTDKLGNSYDATTHQPKNITGLLPNPPEKVSVDDQQKLMQQVDDKFNEILSVAGSTKLGRFLDMVSGNDMNEHKKDMINDVYSYMKNNKNADINTAFDVVLGQKYKKGFLEQYSLSQNGKAINTIENKINTGTVKPDELKMYYELTGTKYDDALLEQVAKTINANYSENAVKEAIVKNYNDETKANMTKWEAFRAGSGEFGYNIMGLLQDVGYLGKDLPEDYYYKKAHEASREIDNNEIANKQVNIPALAAQIGMYVAPTLGLDKIKAGTKVATMLLNSAQYGTADAILAKLYGDDWITNGAISAGAGAVIGALGKAGYKVSDKAREAITRWNKSNMGTPTESFGYRGASSNIRQTPRLEGESAAEYVKRIMNNYPLRQQGESVEAYKARIGQQ